MIELIFVIICALIASAVERWLHARERRELIARIQNPFLPISDSVDRPNRSRRWDNRSEARHEKAARR